jgi:hypothetical protein
MELQVCLADARARQAAVLVDADERAHVGALRTALAELAGVAPGGPLTASGRRLLDDTPIREAGIVAGDVLRLEPPANHPGPGAGPGEPPTAELPLPGGPRRGRPGAAR